MKPFAKIHSGHGMYLIFKHNIAFLEMIIKEVFKLCKIFNACQKSVVEQGP